MEQPNRGAKNDGNGGIGERTAVFYREIIRLHRKLQDIVSGFAINLIDKMDEEHYN